MRLFALLIVALTISGCQSADVEPPDGYRFPIEADYTGEWQAARQSMPAPFHIRADFDGDETLDDAWILLGRNGPNWGLFVFLGAGPSPRHGIPLDIDTGETAPQSMGLALVSPGRYDTACGKGYWECKADEPERLSLDKPAINFFAYESANSFFWWDARTKAFARTWMSD
jgi:hypothetical protein